MPVDPYVATRREFTADLIETPIPDDAAAQYRTRFEKLTKLLKLLADHPAMSENLEQTYMTPAKRKTRVYFVWDFVGRTIGYLRMLDPKLPASVRRSEIWTDVVGRSHLTTIMITDTSGKMDAMMSGSIDPPDVEFGDEIIAAARDL